ncbi:MAG TPA: MarR family transcriptional regulator [Solirubrobacteraceae bacterium]|nr:MarR family transcriptional regulator [Solirubrobacteraceae bacterium]
MSELDAELQAAHGLPLSSWEVLLALDRAPERILRMADLAERVLLTRSGLTRLVDRLERDGLVERRRCPSDARGTNAALTDRGAERLEEATETHVKGVRRRFGARFSEAELEQLAGFWPRLLEDAPAAQPASSAA